MKTSINKLWIVALAMSTITAHAATWQSAQDESGCTWARALIVNDSAADSNWSLSGCRTATSSDADAATIDPLVDWDGIVEAGTSEYVWVYGTGIGDISIANADGDASAYLGSAPLDDIRDGELVIVVSSDGTSSVSVEIASAYAAPAVTGELP